MLFVWACAEICGPPSCPVLCVTSRNEWANAWECFYGFDRGFALTVFDYLDVNNFAGSGNTAGGDGAMLNRDLKARLNREYDMGTIVTSETYTETKLECGL